MKPRHRTKHVQPLSPDRALAEHDPGDETARRYRFQYTWAAIACCALLDNTQDVVEVFCEHHEDVLLKHSDGLFTGQQVKTREQTQPVWKANDTQVRSACGRFAQLDTLYPGYFRSFRFLTNHPLHSGSNAQALVSLLEWIAEAPTLADLAPSARKWLTRVAREAETSEIATFQALKKATASDDLPKLPDSTMRLIHALTAAWAEAQDHSFDGIRRAAQVLIDRCGRAASLDHEQLLPAYLLAIDQPSVETAARIDGKRLTADRVRDILVAGLSGTATLAGSAEKLPEPGQGSTQLLLAKLDAGGFSAVSRNAAEDLRDKADYLGLVWTKRLGRLKGLEQYDHIRSVVLSDAARAFEATKSTGEAFGPVMREDLRRRLHDRRSSGYQLFDCSDEHLEGVAYSLTAQCKVHWSTSRPWEPT